jgi:YD repeat-containing protein
MAQMYDLNDWGLDLPHIHSTFLDFGNTSTSGWHWNNGNACSGPLTPGLEFSGVNEAVQTYQYWNGDTLNIPGRVNDKLLLPANNIIDLGGNTTGITRVTRSNWRLKCLPMTAPNGATYEGFKAYAPNGSVYTFDALRLREGVPYSTANYGLQRYQAYLMVSNITDRFGNTVDYTYDASSRLTRIQASDGREITLGYSGNLKDIRSVAANGRVWTYS